MDPNQEQSFECGVQDWPLSCRAEVTAILVTLLATPRDNETTIITDSQNCITTYKLISKEDPKLTHRRWLKVKNWSIWSNIIEIVKKKDLKLLFKKVKAHSGNRYNEEVDKLVKNAN